MLSGLNFDVISYLCETFLDRETKKIMLKVSSYFAFLDKPFTPDDFFYNVKEDYDCRFYRNDTVLSAEYCESKSRKKSSNPFYKIVSDIDGDFHFMSFKSHMGLMEFENYRCDCEPNEGYHKCNFLATSNTNYYNFLTVSDYLSLKRMGFEFKQCYYCFVNHVKCKCLKRKAKEIDRPAKRFKT